MPVSATGTLRYSSLEITQCLNTTLFIYRINNKVKSKEEAIPFVEGGAKEGGRERVNSGPNSLSYFPTGFQERN